MMMEALNPLKAAGNHNRVDRRSQAMKYRS